VRRTLLAGCFLLASILVLPSQSVKAQESQKCTDAIKTGGNRLKGVPNLELVTGEVKYTSGFVNSSDYPDRAAGRSQRYQFLITGSGVYDLFNSPKFMTDIATPIIQNCPTVSSVDFGRYRSGAAAIIGLFPNGEIKFFKCAEDFGIHPGRSSNNTRKIEWGMRFCSI
jgi:hypothetical protein